MGTPLASAHMPGAEPQRVSGAGGSGGEKSLAKLTAVFAGGNLISTALRLVGGVLTSRAVDPSVLGLFNGIGLVLGYAPFLEGGVLNGLNRELPFFAGKGDFETTRSLAASAQAWVLLVSTVAAIALLAVSGWHLVHGRYEIALGWAAFIMPVFGVFFGQRYLQILYRTHSEFGRISVINVTVASAGVVLVSIVWWLGFAGLFFRVIAIWSISLFLYWKWRPLDVRPAWNFGDLKLLARTGVPIFLVAQLYAWWPVLNSTLVLKYAGVTGLGLYALANMAGPTMAMFPKALSGVVYPSMVEEYARSEDIKILMRMVLRPTVITMASMLGLVWAGWLVIPSLVELILPKYVDGVAAAQWSVVSALVLAFQPMNTIFVVMKKQTLYGIAVASGITVYFVALQWLIRDEARLEAFPQAMLIGRIGFVVVCSAFLWYLERSGCRGCRDVR